MLFNSYIFLLIFLPITYAGYCLFSRAQQPGVTVLWLNLCSFFFYGWWNPAYVPLILASVGINFTLGNWIRQHSGKHAGRMLLIAGVTLNLLCLGYFKYTNFLLDNLNSILGTQYHDASIVLPLAISFFTFQQIAYLIDTWHGKGGSYRLHYYSLFVVFFPHLLAGPIVHHREIIPQFSVRHDAQTRAQQRAIALTAISLGLCKKVIFADTLSFYANQVFTQASNGHALGFVDAWIGVVSFTLQIYFDFSAYSDIACGVALLFGVRLPQNFSSPYQATSIIEFWQRWHMTLSRFLRNYLYIPLGGNRQGSLLRYRNLMLTMLLGGLWHGAGWPFVLWGVIHGGLLVINHFWRSLGNMQALHKLPITPIISGALTYLCVMLAWVMFRADSLDTAINIYHTLFNLHDIQWTHTLRQPVINELCRQYNLPFTPLMRLLPILLGLQLWVLVLPNLSQLMREYILTPTALPEHSTTQLQWRPDWRWSLITVIALTLSLMALYDTGTFIYFQF